MNRNLGIVAFCNDSGLGYQTRRLCELLKPERILVIDSSGFSRNKSQHWEWYDNFQGYRVKGFPTDKEVDTFLKGLTHVFMCENPLNFRLISQAREWGIKSFVQTNYEFCDNLANPSLPEPDYFIMPSYWKVDVMKQKYGDERVIYLPPPLNPNDFKDAREKNLQRKGERIKLLHTVGTLAAHDRNGTLDLLRSLRHAKSDFTLTIKSQHPLPDEYDISNDLRLIFKIGSEPDNQSLYRDFDALVLPRRYGGLCLVYNEALMSGLPLIASDISPQSELFSKIPDGQYAGRLVQGTLSHHFQARVPIQVFQVEPFYLAENIDMFVNMSGEELDEYKLTAFELASKEFSMDSLAEKYNKLWQL